MVKILVTIGMWVLAIICIFIMRKIEPDNKIYPIWALFIAALFTGVTICTICDGLG